MTQTEIDLFEATVTNWHKAIALVNKWIEECFQLDSDGRYGQLIKMIAEELANDTDKE